MRRFILDGQIPQNTLLPSTRSLAEDLKVGRNTVIAAYDQLLAEGFIEARAGSGTWVAPIQQNRPLAALRTGLAAPQNALAARPDHRQRTAAAAQRRRHQFPSRRAGNGVLPLLDLVEPSGAQCAQPRRKPARLSLLCRPCRACAQTIAATISLSRGINCTADQVIIVTGAQAALDLVSRVLMDEGDHVWMEEPGYLGAKSAFLASGARLAPLKVDRRGWHLSDPDLPPPRLIYVTPSCQWPFGTIMRIEERLQLLDIAERHGAWIVEDDYDGEYRFRGRPVPALRGLDHADRVVYIGSLRQDADPGAAHRLSHRAARIVGFLSTGRSSITGQFAPLILQATVNDFITQGYFATHLKRMRRLYARRQANFVKLCQEHLGRVADRHGK